MTSLTRRNRNGNGSTFPSLSDFFGSGLLSSRLFGEDLLGTTVNTPLANISESDSDFKIELSCPGLKASDFKLNVEDGVLTISSEKEEEKRDEKKNYRRHEYSYNSFSRSFELPENTLEDKIDAKYENGVLNVIIPKKEPARSKPKKEIKVQ